ARAGVPGGVGLLGHGVVRAGPDVAARVGPGQGDDGDRRILVGGIGRRAGRRVAEVQRHLAVGGRTGAGGGDLAAPAAAGQQRHRHARGGRVDRDRQGPRGGRGAPDVGGLGREAVGALGQGAGRDGVRPPAGGRPGPHGRGAVVDRDGGPGLGGAADGRGGDLRDPVGRGGAGVAGGGERRRRGSRRGGGGDGAGGAFDTRPTGEDRGHLVGPRPG